MKNLLNYCAALCLLTFLFFGTSLKSQEICEPTNQQATDITAHSVVLSWEGLTGFTKVRYYPTGTTDYKFRGAGLNNTVTLGFLMPETEYTWELSTFCNGYWTEYGWPEVFTTIEDTVVCEPTNQQATDITSTGVILSWESVTVPTRVRFYPTGTTNYKIKGAFYNNTVAINCLTPETDYTWELSTFCEGEWTEFDYPAFFTTLPDSIIPNHHNNMKIAAADDKIEIFYESAAHPNPFDNQTYLNFSAIKETNYSLKIINLQGLTLVESQGLASEGHNSILLHLEKLNPGIYFAIIQSDKSLIKTKLIKR
jgi:hypothetical protein